jgi:hypothetical protein
MHMSKGCGVEAEKVGGESSRHVCHLDFDLSAQNSTVSDWGVSGSTASKNTLDSINPSSFEGLPTR